MIWRADNEKGSVMVYVTIVLVALLGLTALVVDGGAKYLTKSKLQNAVDAAALAGAHDLKTDFNGDGVIDDDDNLVLVGGLEKGPEKTARDYLGYHNIADNDEYDINLDVDRDKLTYNTEIISVAATRHVPLGIARIWGSDTSDVTATAIVGVYPLAIGEGVMPIGVPKSLWETYEAGVPIPLVSHKKFAPGDFGWVDLDGSTGGGESTLRSWIPNGYPGMVKIGDKDPAEPGWMTPVHTALRNRIAGCSLDHSTVPIEPGCPRLVIVPLITDWGGGSAQVTVLGFAAFLLDSVVEENGKDQKVTITGTFVENMIAEGYGNEDAIDYGVYGIKMLK